MKVKELFEHDFYDAKAKAVVGDSIKNYDKNEIKQILDRVFKSKEYKEVMTKCILVSSKIQLNNGLLALEVKDKKFSYDIDIVGNLRLNTYGAFSKNRLSIPEPSDDLYTRYIDNLKLVLEKVEKKSKPSTSIDIVPPLNITSLDEVDLTNITSSFYIKEQSLTSLKGMPTRLTGSLIINDNKKVLSLEGCPKRINGKLSIKECEIDDLEYFPNYVKELYVQGVNSITSFSKITENLNSCEDIILNSCINLKSGLLGLLKIKKLTSVYYSGMTAECGNALRIINKHLKSGRRLSKCREELIEAGLKEYAKL